MKHKSKNRHRKLAVNHGKPEVQAQRLIFCESLVRKDAVRRESVDGIEHVVVSSYTLPDDVVMNGILYPADEIERGYSSLERTLAPIEHPCDKQGNFLSARDPIAIHNFHAGAWNQNVVRENGRVHVEKWINVAEALKSERGRRLLDRIKELENSKDPRPIHTSVGVFIRVESLDAPQTNADGQEYASVARDMYFDHDAILLDSVGAAQPHQGVGMAINATGQRMKAERNYLELSQEQADDGGEEDLIRPSIIGKLASLMPNAEGVSMSAIYEQLNQAIRSGFASEWSCIVDVYADTCVFETNLGYYEVPYRVDNGTATIVGIPVRVDRVVTYSPKQNHATTTEGDAMKELILNALKKAGISTDGMSDDALLAAYNQLQAKATEGNGNAAGTDTAAIAEVVANALKPVTEELAGLKSVVNAGADKERADLTALVINSGKYPGIDEAAAKVLPIESLRQMASNCGASIGIPLTNNSGSAGGYKATDIPE